MKKRRALSLLPVLGVLLLGCPVPVTSDVDAGSSGLVVGDGGIVSVTSGPTAEGSGCTVQTSSGGVLCAGTSLCPGLVVDPSTFVGCGYRIRGDVIDLECECAGFLCPVGAPATCTEAATLLSQQNSGEVCGHTSDGSCLEETPPTTATDAGAQTATQMPGVSPGCDTSCEASCVNDPNCIQACGC